MTYKFDTIVNRKEAESLKNMIFNRVRERSESLSNDTMDDIMTSARSSFASENNPFSQIVEQAKAANDANPKVDLQVDNDMKSTSSVQVLDKNRDDEKQVGFPMKSIQTDIRSQSHLLKEEYALAAIETNMLEAKEGLTSRKSFMDTLNFLNSKAAVSLIRTRTDKFEAIF